VDNIDVQRRPRRHSRDERRGAQRDTPNMPFIDDVAGAQNTAGACEAQSRQMDKKSFMGAESPENSGIIAWAISARSSLRAAWAGDEGGRLRSVHHKEVATRAGIELASLDEVFERSDSSTVHTPMTEERGHHRGGGFRR